MADTTGVDTKVLYLAPALISLIPGLVIHSFIIGVNVSDWWRGRSVTPVDHIVTSLGISRLCSQFSITLEVSVGDLFSPVTWIIINEVYLFFVSANIWLTTFLSIVFCLKISNLHTRLFLYLRRMILHRTHYLIVASLLLSSINCLVDLVLEIIATTEFAAHNTTTKNYVTGCTAGYFVYSYIIDDFFPLLFYYISSVILFISLYHHTTRIKMSSDLSINLETYYSAMRLVSFTFIYNTVYFIVDFICFFTFYFFCVDLLWLYIIYEFLPVLHSSYLIYRTAKLRKVLQDVTDFLFQRKDAEIRENTNNISIRE